MFISTTAESRPEPSRQLGLHQYVASLAISHLEADSDSESNVWKSDVGGTTGAFSIGKKLKSTTCNFDVNSLY